MKRYTLLLFDFDGTLVDTASDIAYHANVVLKSLGFPACSTKGVKDAIGFGVHELFKGIEPSFESDPKLLEGAVVLFKKSYRERPVIETAPYPHVREILVGPLADITKAIITNKPYDITLQILETLSLQDFFEDVIGMNAGYPAKPDPTSMRVMMDKFGASPASTIYIGDSNVDAETARNAGVDFAWVDYGYDILRGSSPTYQFSSAAEWVYLLSAEREC